MIVIKKDDSRYAIDAILRNEKGVISLTDAREVRFYMHDSFGNLIADNATEVIDATNGELRMILEVSHTSKSGYYRAEFKVIYSDGRIATFPNDSYVDIQIKKRFRK